MSKLLDALKRARIGDADSLRRLHRVLSRSGYGPTPAKRMIVILEYPLTFDRVEAELLEWVDSDQSQPLCINGVTIEYQDIHSVAEVIITDDPQEQSGKPSAEKTKQWLDDALGGRQS